MEVLINVTNLTYPNSYLETVCQVQLRLTTSVYYLSPGHHISYELPQKEHLLPQFLKVWSPGAAWWDVLPRGLL